MTVNMKSNIYGSQEEDAPYRIENNKAARSYLEWTSAIHLEAAHFNYV